jgi:hypothetical protein
MAVIDLNPWHRTLHGVTGAMALRWCRATVDDLRTWSVTLRGIADAMQARANATAALQAPTASAPCAQLDQIMPLSGWFGYWAVKGQLR